MLVVVVVVVDYSSTVGCGGTGGVITATGSYAGDADTGWFHPSTL